MTDDALATYRIVATRQSGDRRVIAAVREPGDAAAISELLNAVGDKTAHVEIVHAEELEHTNDRVLGQDDHRGSTPGQSTLEGSK